MTDITSAITVIPITVTAMTTLSTRNVLFINLPSSSCHLLLSPFVCFCDLGGDFFDPPGPDQSVLLAQNAADILPLAMFLACLALKLLRAAAL